MSAYQWSCADCAHLDKSKKKWDDNHYCYLYGCKARNGYVCGWCVHDRKDKELREMGCSNFQPKQTTQAPKQQNQPTTQPPQQPQTITVGIQLSIFDII